jgi:hypothetical protein
MLEAFGWGLLAQSSLLVAGLVVCWVTVPTKVVGVLGGFGAGATIAAVSFGSQGAGGAMGIRRLHPRLTSRQLDGARDGSASSGCSSSSPQEACSRCSPTH